MVERPYRYFGPKRPTAGPQRGANWLAVGFFRGFLKAASFLSGQPARICLGALMRIVGPWLPRHRVGQENLAAAFPDMTPDEREQILIRMWTNLGYVIAEFALLDRWAHKLSSDLSMIVYDDDTKDRFQKLQNDGTGALIFSAHIGNWELPAVVPHSIGLDTAVLYRAPSVRSAAQAISEVRTRSMGQMIASSFHAPFALAAALRQGKHVGMLVDQHDARGVPVTFFGRPCRTTPLIAMLAREQDVPIHGVVAKRLEDGRFRVELTPRLTPARNTSQQIDVTATMQLIADQIEAWIRETPDQWLWIHRRWRDEVSG